MIFCHVNNITASTYLNRSYPIELEITYTNYRFSLNASVKVNHGTIKFYHLILYILNLPVLVQGI